MHGAAQRMDNCEQQLEFLRKRWLDREQELITVIQEETKRTEEKEEAGYRSPKEGPKGFAVIHLSP